MVTFNLTSSLYTAIGLSLLALFYSFTKVDYAFWYILIIIELIFIFILGILQRLVMSIDHQHELKKLDKEIELAKVKNDKKI